MINQIATNTSNGYYLSKSQTCHVISFLLQHVLKIASCSTNASGITLKRLANSTFNNAQPRAAHSLLMRHFSSSTYNMKMNRPIIN